MKATGMSWGWAGAGAIVVIAAMVVWMAGRGLATPDRAQAGIPPRPDLTSAPPALRARIDAAEVQARTGPDRVGALASLSRLYLANGFFPEATHCYQVLRQIEPANPRWPHLLGHVLAGFGQLAEALPLFRRALELAPDNVPGRLRLADALLKTGQRAEADQNYRAVLTRDAQNPYALMGRARCALAEQRWPEARETLEIAVRAHADFQAGWSLLADVRGRLGDAEGAAAAEAYVRQTPRFREAPDPWLDELWADCFDPYRLAVAAAVAHDSKDLPTARALLERALAIKPDNAANELLLGRYLQEAGEFVAARQHLEKAVQLAPRDGDAWVHLVTLLTAVGDARGVDRALLEGLALCPGSPGLHLERGRRLKTLGRSEEALAALAESVRLRPDFADAYLERAGIFVRLERMEESLAEVRLALKAEPEHPFALMFMARHAIAAGDETASREAVSRLRRQPRVLPEDLATLTALFRGRFGRAP